MAVLRWVVVSVVNVQLALCQKSNFAENAVGIRNFAKNFVQFATMSGVEVAKNKAVNRRQDGYSHPSPPGRMMSGTIYRREPQEMGLRQNMGNVMQMLEGRQKEEGVQMLRYMARVPPPPGKTTGKTQKIKKMTQTAMNRNPSVRPMMKSLMKPPAATRTMRAQTPHMTDKKKSSSSYFRLSVVQNSTQDSRPGDSYGYGRGRYDSYYSLHQGSGDRHNMTMGMGNPMADRGVMMASRPVMAMGGENNAVMASDGQKMANTGMMASSGLMDSRGLVRSPGLMTSVVMMNDSHMVMSNGLMVERPRDDVMVQLMASGMLGPVVDLEPELGVDIEAPPRDEMVIRMMANGMRQNAGPMMDMEPDLAVDIEAPVTSPREEMLLRMMASGMVRTPMMDMEPELSVDVEAPGMTGSRMQPTVSDSASESKEMFENIAEAVVDPSAVVEKLTVTEKMEMIQEIQGMRMEDMDIVMKMIIENIIKEEAGTMSNVEKAIVDNIMGKDMENLGKEEKILLDTMLELGEEDLSVDIEKMVDTIIEKDMEDLDMEEKMLMTDLIRNSIEDITNEDKKTVRSILRKNMSSLNTSEKVVMQKLLEGGRARLMAEAGLPPSRPRSEGGPEPPSDDSPYSGVGKLHGKVLYCQYCILPSHTGGLIIN